MVIEHFPSARHFPSETYLITPTTLKWELLLWPEEIIAAQLREQTGGSILGFKSWSCNPQDIYANSLYFIFFICKMGMLSSIYLI